MKKIATFLLSLQAQARQSKQLSQLIWIVSLALAMTMTKEKNFIGLTV